jgi:hypothetical protein
MRTMNFEACGRAENGKTRKLSLHAAPRKSDRVFTPPAGSGNVPVPANFVEKMARQVVGRLAAEYRVASCPQAGETASRASNDLKMLDQTALRTPAATVSVVAAVTFWKIAASS